MMTKNLLLITGENQLTVINVNSHSLVRTISVPNSSWINAACLLTSNKLLTVDNNKAICFYDILERKIKATISNISKYDGCRAWFIMMKKDLLLIPGSNQLSIINTNEYKLIRTINVPNASTITGVCLLNKDMLLTGDYSETIRQWKIEGDNLVMTSKKEKANERSIGTVLKIGNGLIITGDDDGYIKVW